MEKQDRKEQTYLGLFVGRTLWAQWDNVITKEQADYLRDKYLGI